MNHKYVNVQYPWDGHENPLEPNIPENNHVALYRRKFTVSAPVANAKQAGGSVSIVFHGMATAIYVWVNGAFVGYGEDGFTPNEFDITGLLHDGENVVAFPCAILYGRLAGRFGCKVMITAAVVAYMCIVFFAAFFLKSAVEFWILAILVGMFQGGIQALSRSYYGKIIPKDHANEYYGFYDIFGKTASIIGTFLVATTTSLTGNASLGVLSIAVLLVAALVFLLLQKDPTRE